ncbi:cytochrome C [Bradyrhizobium canariense]|uniref:Cytochrome C n=1 Tax=Bradyrhizobium canariense TaxID=255045 RepID=A0ABX3WXI8_9BRAD|nr:cytochrome c [Bradyrhizobium canariense]OSJ08882.1 cytochrome C [Bradyrhizobium canariense]OSJ24276.1 cytochrome C [Bradyrhizobium canariense]
MTLRLTLFGITAGAALIFLGGFAWTWRPAIPPINLEDHGDSDAKAIWRGAQLAAIGNCNDCHRADTGESYAGGRPLPTPFGTIYSSNITPDAETGIGTWPEAAFKRAMREGVDREGRQLYPAFPYDHFTKATDEDLGALYAFLRTQLPFRKAAPANALIFPFGFRPIVAGWKLLFFREARFQPEGSKGDAWNRGRYLVEGLAHCGGCHTPRNVFGAEKGSSSYAGGVAEGWDAPPLNSGSLAVHRWNADDLFEYLSTGWNRLHGAAAGPMADVTNNLGGVSSTDVRAIAVYVASLSADSGDTAAPVQTNKIVATSEVRAIYEGACANCHRDPNVVGPSKAVSLSLSSAVRQWSAANTVRVVLGGIQARSGAPGAYMPAFGGILTDSQIASLADYVRARYTDQPQWADSLKEVSKARQEGSTP